MKKPTNLNQNGVVSFITIMLLSIILVMITVSFVKASTSNLRESLDSQLATQAFYAAESGVNDAISVIKHPGSYNIKNAINDANGNCSLFIDAIKTVKSAGADVNKLDSSAPISYSCVLVSNIIDDITFEPGSSGNQYLINSSTTQIVNKIKINWGKSGQTAPLASTGLPPQGTWGADKLSMLRVSFYYPPSLALSRSNLITHQKTLFLKPVSSVTADIDGRVAVDGSIENVYCNGSVCSATIDVPYASCSATIDVPCASAVNDLANGFYVRVVPIYNTDTSVTITGYNGNTQLKLTNAQYSIDVTGRANDVYKRIDYRFSIGTQYEYPSSAAMSGGGTAGDLCKQIIVWPGGYSNEAGGDCVFGP